MGKLSLEIVTPEGIALQEPGLEGVVVRRKEPGGLGSEIAVMPRHGPMLVRVQPCRLRFYRGGKTSYVEIDGGFMEVVDDKVTVVTTGSLLPGDSAESE